MQDNHIKMIHDQLGFKGKKFEQSPINNNNANTQIKFIKYLLSQYPFISQ